MEKVKINIGGKEYNVRVAQTDSEREIGLQNTQDLPENGGMLFIFDDIDEVSIWMKDTEIPLDIVFINEDMEVIKVHSGIPLKEDLMTESDVSMVLEVNKGSGIKEGDELEFLNNSSKMKVLNEKGEIQMELSGGERIFSRLNTKILIKFAKKADFTKNDNDYKALGKRVFKFLTIQDSNDPQYVKNV